MKPTRALLVATVGVALALAPAPARAAGRIEIAARRAIARARAEHRARRNHPALRTLQHAERACEPDHCSMETLATLLRDIGALKVMTGDEDGARSDFAAAIGFDANAQLDRAFATSEVLAVWNDVKSPQTAPPTGGDFDHTPATEQKVGVPLPVFVTYHGSAHPASVVVRYRGPGGSKFRRLELVRMAGGWGNVIPCGAIKLGRVQYYFQGFDSDGLPILESGDLHHPYSVPVKREIEGPRPHLPGHKAPTMCGEGMVEAEEEAGPAETGGGAGGAGGAAAPTMGAYRKIWIGVSGGIDITVVPQGNDVCTRSTSDGSASDPNWACTNDTPPGTDFPLDANENSTLVQGQAGSVNSGLQAGNVRVKLTFDYAVTGNLMLGLAVGYVVNSYYGTVLPKFPPLHLEARATWVFGDRPLAHDGFAPFIQVGGGAAEYDANLAVQVAQNGVAGVRPVQAWHVGGPGFVTAATGTRYAFSPRIGLFLAIRGTLAFGTGFFPAFGPEIALQAGF